MRLIFPILLLAASVAGFFMFIDPQYKEVQALKEQIVQYDSALQASNDVKKQKTILAEEDKKIINRNGGVDEDRLKKILPRRVDTIKFILDVNNLARTQNVFLKNLMIGSDTKSSSETSAKANLAARQGGFKSTTFSFSVSTSYEAFLSLLRALERNLEVMDINSISFHTSDTNIYDFSMSGTVYSFE